MQATLEEWQWYLFVAWVIAVLPTATTSDSAVDSSLIRRLFGKQADGSLSPDIKYQLNIELAC